VIRFATLESDVRPLLARRGAADDADGLVDPMAPVDAGACDRIWGAGTRPAAKSHANRSCQGVASPAPSRSPDAARIARLRIAKDHPR
jgi:hypothetical protein